MRGAFRYFCLFTMFLFAPVVTHAADLILISFSGNKLPVIRAVRDCTGLGLAEAKNLVDAAPTVVYSNDDMDAVSACKATIDAAGGVTEIQQESDDNDQHFNGKFYITTTATTTSFQFAISASGIFDVDCGDGGTLSGTGVSGNTITKNNTNDVTYTCTYGSAGAHKIGFGGAATGYSSDKTKAAIRFNINDANVKKIAGIRGSLGAIFGTVGSNQPRFVNTFMGAVA